MKIAMAQIEIVPGVPNKNVAKMLDYIGKAKASGADMVVFPELCIPGYLIADQLEEDAFTKDCESYNKDIREAARQNGIIVVYGNLRRHNGPTPHKDGRTRLFNTLQYVIPGKDPTDLIGEQYGERIKSLLPNYREFEEPRHYTPATDLFGLDYYQPVDINGVKIGLVLCEDGWFQDYPINPIGEYVKRGAGLIINISCSPYTRDKNRARDRVFGQGHAKGNKVPLIYVNSVGIQNNGKTVYTFDGSSVAYDSHGEIMVQAPMFEEGLYYVVYDDHDLIPCPIESNPMLALPTGNEEVLQAMKYGAKKFLERCGTNRVVIGASGGIDSAVVASLFAQIVGPENLMLVNMPSQYNSDTTKNLARELAKNIGCYYAVLPIGSAVELTRTQIDGLEIGRILNPETTDFDKISSVTDTLHLSPLNMENVQARDRSTRILAAVASAWGGVYTCNGNKSEISVGYVTISGDNAGFFAPLGDLWKTQVYEIGRHMNKTYPVIPEGCFTVKASAELSPEQNVDEGKGDPFVYWYHDKLFASWQEWWFRVTPEENLKWYLDGTINEKLSINHLKVTDTVYYLFPTVKAFTDDLERWYRLFKGFAVAKRVQAPPILGLCRRVFGFDFREYIGEAYFTREYLRLKAEALEKEKRK